MIYFVGANAKFIFRTYLLSISYVDWVRCSRAPMHDHCREKMPTGDWSCGKAEFTTGFM